MPQYQEKDADMEPHEEEPEDRLTLSHLGHGKGIAEGCQGRMLSRRVGFQAEGRCRSRHYGDYLHDDAHEHREDGDIDKGHHYKVVDSIHEKGETCVYDGLRRGAHRGRDCGGRERR